MDLKVLVQIWVAQILRTSHVMTYWKCNSLQLFSAQSMKMSMWSCGIAFLHFIQHVLFFPCLLQYVYAYVCISVSLSFISPSLWKSLGVYFSLCGFLLIFHLTLTSFSSLWISLSHSLYLGFFFQLSLLFQLGERYTVLYTLFYIRQAVWPQLMQKPLAFQIAPL